MLDVEVLGHASGAGPSGAELRRLCRGAAAALGVSDGHVAVEFVSEDRIAELNDRHRGHREPTDVLSFPIDGAAPSGDDSTPRELGDIVICAAHTRDLREAVVHGMLHLLGMDHEADSGEMLRLQGRLLRQVHR